MRIGRYNVVAVLGHGAFGEVFHARLDGPMGFRKDVALKRLHPHLVRGNPAVVQALVDEARLGGLLRHPNIVESHEFEQDGGTWFLAMEFVDGITLQQLAALSEKAGRPMPPAVALEIVEQICGGLDYAHTLADAGGAPLRVVHRDLKPANLMLSREGVVKIMDFGMAKASSNLKDSTASGTIKGTPAYMSPEQVSATRSVSEVSDLYAVGVILYELLMGRRLFEADTAVAVMFAVMQGVSEAQVAALEAQLPGAGPLFARCTATNPDERWRSAAELGRAVHALRATLPEPPNALRSMAVGLLQGPSRLAAEDLAERSDSFRDFLDSLTLERSRAVAGSVADEADATRDAVGVAEVPEVSPPSFAAPAGTAPRRAPWPPLAAGAVAALALAAGGALWSGSAGPPAAATPEPMAAEAETPPAAPVEAPVAPVQLAEAAEPAPEPEAPKVAGTAVATRPKPVGAPPAAPVYAGTGLVIVKASRWGKVLVDGAPVEGTTPKRLDLPAGPHVIEVQCGECVPAATKRFDVTVADGGKETIEAAFEP